MNPKPIDTARDADLRLSVAAMHRAARRAWEVALQTGTAIVVRRQGMLQTITPTAAAIDSSPIVQERPADYGAKP